MNNEYYLVREPKDKEDIILDVFNRNTGLAKYIYPHNITPHSSSCDITEVDTSHYIFIFKINDLDI